MTEQFWRLWAYNYVLSLKERLKALKENVNLPVFKWEVGRIVGSDRLVRVASVKAASSEIVRHIVQLCRLPICPPFIRRTKQFVSCDE